MYKYELCRSVCVDASTKDSTPLVLLVVTKELVELSSSLL